jgi:hypothetical protein
MSPVLPHVDSSLTGAEPPRDANPCIDSQIDRAGRQWYDRWCRQTGRRVPELERVRQMSLQHDSSLESFQTDSPIDVCRAAA